MGGTGRWNTIPANDPKCWRYWTSKLVYLLPRKVDFTKGSHIHKQLKYIFLSTHDAASGHKHQYPDRFDEMSNTGKPSSTKREKNGSPKLHISVQNMIINASENPNQLITVYSISTCSQLLKCSTIGKVKKSTYNARLYLQMFSRTSNRIHNSSLWGILPTK